MFRKKDVQSICDSLSRLTGPLCFYDVEGASVYKTEGFGEEKSEENERREIIVLHKPVGYVSGPPGKLSIAADIVEYVLKTAYEKKCLASHTLFKYEELEFFSKLGEIFGTFILTDDILSATAKLVKSKIGAENCSIMIIDSLSEKYNLKAVSGKIVNDKSWLSPNQGIAAKTMKSGKPVIVNNPEEHPDFVEGGKVKITSMMCVPLKLKDKTMGTLNLSNKLEGIFTSEDESLVLSISALISEVIENSRLHDERVKNQKFAVIGEMAAGIIHDFRNPLGVISGFLEFLADSNLSDEERKRISAMTNKATMSLSRMVEDLHSYSKGTKIVQSIKNINIHSFIQDIIPLVEMDMSFKKIKVETRVEYKGDLRLDPERFLRVVWNISGNARDSMSKGGKFLILARTKGKEVEFVFSDTGTGIPLEIMDTLFDAFTTQGKSRGTGLGLAITKQIVVEHGGRIQALNGNYSGVEGFNGANFVVSLPLG